MSGNGTAHAPKLTPSTVRGLRAVLALLDVELDIKELGDKEIAAYQDAYRYIVHIIDHAPRGATKETK